MNKEIEDVWVSCQKRNSGIYEDEIHDRLYCWNFFDVADALNFVFDNNNNAQFLSPPKVSV